MSRLNADIMKKVDEIAERYCTSVPVSGSWETELEHELNAIQSELGLSRLDAELALVELGF